MTSEIDNLATQTYNQHTMRSSSVNKCDQFWRSLTETSNMVQNAKPCTASRSLKLHILVYFDLSSQNAKIILRFAKRWSHCFKKKRWSSISGLTLRITIWTYGAQNGSIPITAYMNNRINEYSEVVSIWFLQSALCIYYHIKIFKTLMIGQNQEIMCVIIEYPPFNKIK